MQKKCRSPSSGFPAPFGPIRPTTCPAGTDSVQSASAHTRRYRLPGSPEVLRIRELPVPHPQPRQVLIQVKASGLNRSELHFRQGLAASGTFPRVPGIEATGIVAAAPGGEFAPGTQVVTMMGGMGRAFDGGYAEYVLVPAAQVTGFTSALPREQIGAVPEMLQTAYGPLTTGVRAQPGQSLLIRGGTSSVGMALIVLAKRHGLAVYATTRREQARARLESLGAEACRCQPVSG